MQSFRWNDRGNDILGTLAEFYEHGKFVDCTFVIEGRKIRAHKVILCASSSYFQKLLNSKSGEGKLTLKDVKFRDLNNILNLMYFGTVDVPLNEVTSFIKTAQLLEVNGINKFEDIEVKEEFLSEYDQDEHVKQHEENEPDDVVKDSDLQPICSVTIPVYNEMEETTIKTEPVDCDLDDNNIQAEEENEAAEEENEAAGDDPAGTDESEVLSVSRCNNSSEILSTGENLPSFYNENQLNAPSSSSLVKEEIQLLPLSSDGEFERSDTIMFQCQECRISFPNGTMLQSHMHQHLEGKSGSEEIMPNKFLEIHMDSHSERGQFERELLQKRFDHNSDLMDIPISREAGSNLYVCNDCGKSFDKKIVWYIHSSLHGGRSDVSTCKICGKDFLKRSAVVSHMYKKHTLERGYSCRVCNQRFRKIYLLRKHLHKHSERPYKCEVCQKAYMYESGLQKHLESHGKIKECNVCDKKFKIFVNYEKHMMAHSRKMGYKCFKCLHCFSSSRDLELHSKSHESEQPLME